MSATLALLAASTSPAYLPSGGWRVEHRDKSWGVDPGQVDPARAPRPLNMHSAFQSSDYPATLAQAGLSGRVIALLQVAPDGAVTNCRIAVGGAKLFNDATCAGARRARFDPARDEQGHPVQSVYVLPVRWLQ